jgi:hypothetical protein
MESSFIGSMQTQSEPNLGESQFLREFHLGSIPLQIQIHMGEMSSKTDRQEAISKHLETLRRYDTS